MGYIERYDPHYNDWERLEGDNRSGRKGLKQVIELAKRELAQHPTMTPGGQHYAAGYNPGTYYDAPPPRQLLPPRPRYPSEMSMPDRSCTSSTHGSSSTARPTSRDSDRESRSTSRGTDRESHSTSRGTDRESRHSSNSTRRSNSGDTSKSLSGMSKMTGMTSLMKNTSGKTRREADIPAVQRDLKTALPENPAKKSEHDTGMRHSSQQGVTAHKTSRHSESKESKRSEAKESKHSKARESSASATGTHTVSGKKLAKMSFNPEK